MNIYELPPVYSTTGTTGTTGTGGSQEDDDRLLLRITHAPLPGNTDRWLVSDSEYYRELWADVPLLASYVGACLPSKSPAGHTFRVSTDAGIDMSSMSSCVSHADTMRVVERLLRYMHAIQRISR